MNEVSTPQTEDDIKIEPIVPKRNTPYFIEVKSPLLRPGLTITSGPVSERYVVEETMKLLDMVRKINSKR